MSKSKVIKRFRDKNTNKVHEIGSSFEGAEERLSELKELGYLENSEPSILDGNVQEVINALDGLSKEELEALLAKEKEDKKRKTVIDYIESLLS